MSKTLADRLDERCCPAGLPHTGDDPVADHGHTDCYLMRLAAIQLRQLERRVAWLEQEARYRDHPLGGPL